VFFRATSLVPASHSRGNPDHVQTSRTITQAAARTLLTMRHLDHPRRIGARYSLVTSWAVCRAGNRRAACVAAADRGAVCRDVPLVTLATLGAEGMRREDLWSLCIQRIPTALRGFLCVPSNAPTNLHP
jgi:hypothetical protein